MRWAPDARYWRRLWSVQLMIVSAFFSGVSSIVPTIWGGTPWVVEHPFVFVSVVGVLNVLAIAGRLVDQGNVPD
jgi:hypothetical protein